MAKPYRLLSDLNSQWAWMQLSKKAHDVITSGGYTNWILVDSERGNDDTGLRQSFVKPFQTIAAAVAVAETDDIVFIAPGTYGDPDAKENTINLTGSSIHFVGFERTSTIISDEVIYSSDLGNTWTSITFSNLSFVRSDNSDSNPCVLIDGTGSPSVFGEPEAGLVFDNCYFERTNADITNSCLQIFTANYVRLRNCTFNNGVFLHNVHRCITEGCDVEPTATEDFTVVYNEEGGSVEPNLGRGNHAMSHSLIPNTLRMEILASLFVGSDNQIGTLHANLRDSATPLYGTVQCSGRIGTVDLSHQMTNIAAGTTIARFDHAKISTAFEITDEGSDRRIRITANNAVFSYATADEIYAGPYCDLDIRGSSYVNQEVLDVDGGANSGTIDRSFWTYVVAAPGGATDYDISNADAKLIPYPATVTGSGSYHVTIEADNIADLPAVVTAKTDTQVTVQSTAANGNITLGLHRPFSD